MAQFGSLLLGGGGVGLHLPVRVLMVVLIMTYSPVTAQTTEGHTTEETTDTFGNMTESLSTQEESTAATTTSALTCAKNCYDCSGTGESDCTQCNGSYTLTCEKCDYEDSLTPSCKCEIGKCILIEEAIPLPILIGVIAGGVVIVIVVVAVIICCCRRRGPPKPVKRDFRLSAVTGDLPYPQNEEFPSNDEVGIVGDIEATTDDIYGNVDNQGNVLRFNMPDEKERPSTSNSSKPMQQDFGDIYENNTPSLPVASFPVQGQDFGDVYENTTVGNAPQPVTINRTPPSIPFVQIPSSSARQKEDFGEVYTNEPIQPTKNAPFNSRELLQRINNQASPDSHQAPSVPRRPAPPALPTTSKPSRRPEFPQDNEAFENDDLHDDVHVGMPMPTRPAPTVNTSSQSLRLPAVAPALLNPGNKFKSLPVQTKETPSDFTDPDDFTDQPSRLPPAPPSVKPDKQTSAQPLKSSPPTKAMKPPSPTKQKAKIPPQTKKKKAIERYVDDNDVKGEVEMGLRPVQSKPDYGEDYEDVEAQSPKDFGTNYEVWDIQPKPKEDFGLLYEYVATSEQDNGGPDYGGSYEMVDTPIAQDYGEDYEFIEKPNFDISRRAPMPTPKSAAPYSPQKAPPPVVKKKSVPSKPVNIMASAGVARSSPSHHGNSGQDSDNNDWGEDYTNVQSTGGGRRNRPPAHYPPPALPRKLSLPKQGNDFYDDVLQAVDGSKEAEDVPYTPGKYYRNVPAKREEPQKHGGYIHFQSKGHN